MRRFMSARAIGVWVCVMVAAAGALAGGGADAGPSYVHAPPMRADAQPVAVDLPAVVEPGVFPRTVLVEEQIDRLRRLVDRDARAAEAYRVLLGNADRAVARSPVFPDPAGPLAQVKDRNDAPAKAHDRLSFDAGNLARAWAFTGEQRYAQRAAEILLGYARRYAEYPEHQGVNRQDTGKVMAQRLSEAMWLIPLLQAYDLIHGSGVLSEADHDTIEHGLIRPAITFIWRRPIDRIIARRDRENPDWRTATPTTDRDGTVGNWMVFYNTATMLAGAVLEDPDLVDLAAANLRELLVRGIGSDGMWNEGAIGYHYFAMHGFLPAMETAARQGVDLWSFDGNRFKRLFDAPLLYAYPDGSMPGINDSGRRRPGNWQTSVYDYALLRYGDPRYRSIVRETPRQLHFSPAVYSPTLIYGDLPSPPVVTYPSLVFDALGYAVLRDHGLYALMDYGPHGGVHGHPDKLNLILFGLGDEQGGEPQFHRYEDPLHRQWTTQTIAHNTITVDQRSQAASEGRLSIYEATPGVKVMRGHAAEAYPDVTLDRTVVLLEDVVLDLFTGRSTTARTWDRTLRFAGDLQALRVGPDAPPLGDAAGYQHIRVGERVPACNGWRGVWRSDGGTLRVHLAGRDGQQVHLGAGPDGAELAVARQQGERADFGVAYRFAPADTDAPAIDLTLPAIPDDRLVAMQLHRGGRLAGLLLVNHGATTWSALGWESDARVLYVLLRGDAVDEVLVLGGTFARRGELAIRHPRRGNFHARVMDGTPHITMHWTPQPPATGPARR